MRVCACMRVCVCVCVVCIVCVCVMCIVCVCECVFERESERERVWRSPTYIKMKGNASTKRACASAHACVGPMCICVYDSVHVHVCVRVRVCALTSCDWKNPKAHKLHGLNPSC